LSTGTYLGFDFGTRRIGVAVGEQHTAMAQPLATVPARDGRPDWPGIDRLVATWQPAGFVVGLPFNMDDTEAALAPRARAFGKRLSARYNRPVHLVDERLTSRTARAVLREAGATRRRTAARVDALAAQQILQTFLDDHSREAAVGAR